MIHKNKPYDFPDEFKSFVMMPRFDSDLEALATLAENEDWGYKLVDSSFQNPVLRNYVFYSYMRIAEEKKVAITTDEESACWNTGLITSSQQPIFMLLSRNKLDG